LIVAIALPDFVFCQLGLKSTIHPLVKVVCTFLYVLLENVFYASFAFLTSRILGSKGKFTSVFVACSFAQLAYLLLLSNLFFMDAVAVLTSLAITILAIRQATKLSWLKIIPSQVVLFVVALGLIMQGGPLAGNLIYTALENYETQNSRTAENPRGAEEPMPPEPDAQGAPQSADPFDDAAAINEPPTDARKAADARHPPAPNIIIHTADGREIPLASLKGKVVVLDFWASWCAPCRRALPLVNQVAGTFRPKGVEFFAINANESKDVAESYLRKNDIGLTLALDKDEANANKIGASGLPYIVVINKRGNIEAVHEGYSPTEDDVISMEIEAALAEP
jgi:thiol-disulfide isomerase/thioredoxin